MAATGADRYRNLLGIKVVDIFHDNFPQNVFLSGQRVLVNGHHIGFHFAVAGYDGL